jgi:putative transposase
MPRSAQPWVATMVRTIFDQPDAACVRDQFARVVEAIEARFPDAATHLDDAREDLLAFAGFPHEIWRQIWSNNPQVIWSPPVTVFHVLHLDGRGSDLCAGHGYLPRCSTQIFRRNDACSAGRLARLAA